MFTASSVSSHSGCRPRSSHPWRPGTTWTFRLMTPHLHREDWWSTLQSWLGCLPSPPRQRHKKLRHRHGATLRRCVYLKAGETLSLRYRRDGKPDCASVQQDNTDASITRSDLRELTQQMTRSIEELRRDIGAVRREMEHTRSELENIRRETRQPRAQ